MATTRKRTPVPRFVPKGARDVTEFRHGRNFVRVGDVVKVKLNGRSSRVEAKITRILVSDEDDVREVEVVTQGDHRAFRTVTPDAITRKARSRQEGQA